MLHKLALPALVAGVAWEERKRGGRYYYRSRRQGARVLKEYVGAGLIADFSAEEDQLNRERREVEKLKEQEDLEHLNALAAPVIELSEAAQILARAHLIAAGCHRHKGEWRRAREHSA